MAFASVGGIAGGGRSSTSISPLSARKRGSLITRAGPPTRAPALTPPSELAIFHAENWTKSWWVVAVGDDLIVVEQGDDPDLLRIRSEYRHAEVMRALIRQAETLCQTTSRTLRRSPAGSA